MAYRRARLAAAGANAAERQAGKTYTPVTAMASAGWLILKAILILAADMTN